MSGGCNRRLRTRSVIHGRLREDTMRKTQIVIANFVITILLYLIVAGSANADLAILTRPKEESTVEWNAFVVESLARGNTVITHKSPDGILLRGVLFVRSDGIDVIAAGNEAVGWANALAKAGGARIITFEDIAADLFNTEKSKPSQ